METLKNENKASNDPMKSETSPLSFKEASQLEGSVNLSSEISGNEQSGGSQQDRNDSGSQQISDSFAVDTTSTEEKDDSIEEIGIETRVTRDDEAKIRKGSSVFETNNVSKCVNSTNTEIVEVDKQNSLQVAEMKDSKRKRKTSR